MKPSQPVALYLLVERNHSKELRRIPCLAKDVNKHKAKYARNWTVLGLSVEPIELSDHCAH